MARLTIEYVPQGLGTNLSYLSVLAHSGNMVDLMINHTQSARDFMDLVTALNIPNINVVTAGSAAAHTITASGHITDHEKFLSPYIRSPKVSFNGNSYPTGFRNVKKTCIGLTLAPSSAPEYLVTRSTLGNTMSNVFPKNRLHPLEDYTDLFSLLKLAGYDVMTLDEWNIPLTDKIFLINEYCDCLIGYEGGLMHLAHVLQVPSIILPWRKTAGGDDLRDQYPIHNIHLDKKTFILPSDGMTQLKSWSPAQLRNTISELYADRGNNIYLQDNAVIFNPELTHYMVEDVFGWCNIDSIMSPNALQFSREHDIPLKVAGAKDIILKEM